MSRDRGVCLPDSLGGIENSLPLVKKPQVLVPMTKSRLRSSITANGGIGESVTAGDMPFCTFLAWSAVVVATAGCHCVFSDRAHAPKRANAAAATIVLLRTIVSLLYYFKCRV